MIITCTKVIQSLGGMHSCIMMKRYFYVTRINFQWDETRILLDTCLYNFPGFPNIRQ